MLTDSHLFASSLLFKHQACICVSWCIYCPH